MRSGKLVIAQGGGPTAVINQSLAGAVLEARLFPQIERIYGARHGVRGIVDEDFVDLSAESRANLEAIAATPSSALGSTRDKPDLAYCRNILASLKATGASWFLYIGGNDTADTVRIVSEEAAKEGFDLRSIHIPVSYTHLDVYKRQAQYGEWRHQPRLRRQAADPAGLAEAQRYRSARPVALEAAHRPPGGRWLARYVRL